MTLHSTQTTRCCRRGGRVIAAARRAAVRFAVCQSGAAITLIAALTPVVIGGLGLGAETGYWYLTQRKLQHAADMASYAAATRKRAGDDSGEVATVAARETRESGFAGGGVNVTVNSPPSTGAHTTDPEAVEVLLATDLPRLFTALYGTEPVSLKARAVARVEASGEACVLALSRSAPGAVTVSGSSTVTLSGCEIASNSLAADAFLLSGASASVTADCVNTVGEVNASTRLTLTACDAPRENQPPIGDPYASVPEPDASAVPCSSASGDGSVTPVTLTPTAWTAGGTPVMRFCAGLTLKGAVHFDPGIYVIEGILTASAGAQITGTGVTFFMENGGAAKFNGDADLNVSAPTSGTYSGLLFFGDRATAASQKINGGATSRLDGAIYLPASHLEFTGNSSTSGACLQIVANTIAFSGKSTISSSCGPSMRQALARQVVRLVE